MIDKENNNYERTAIMVGALQHLASPATVCATRDLVLK